MNETATQPGALSFPCAFPVKVFGVQAEDFDQVVVGIIRRHVADLGEGAVSIRPSRGGRFQAVTVTVRATSQAQLDAIYRDLGACAQVLMAL